MVRNLRITIDGQTYAVSVEDMTDPLGSFYPSPAMSMERLEPAVAVPPPPPPPPPAAVAPPPAPAPATKPAASSAPVDPNPGDVTCPMTGILVDYTVKVGDTVTAGQQVATLEAMKMKTVVAAHQAGTVLKLHAEPGNTVDSGAVLVSVK